MGGEINQTHATLADSILPKRDAKKERSGSSPHRDIGSAQFWQENVIPNRFDRYFQRIKLKRVLVGFQWKTMVLIQALRVFQPESAMKAINRGSSLW